MPEIIKSTGDYKKLLSYQKTDVIYQITFFFCHNFLDIGDRTVDQMIQAARSGKQNIIEGVLLLPHRQRPSCVCSMLRRQA